MKKLASIVLVLLLVQGMTVEAQTKKKEQLKKEKASERQRSLGGQRENGEGTGVPPAGKPQEQTDSETNEQSANSPVIQSNRDQNQASDGVETEGTNEQAAEKKEKSNAPAVVQTTSSESGSPAILSKDDGKGRDGTNNVQRSSYNMAGAEVPGNMNLSDKNHGERNVNMGKTRVKKQEEQPIRTTIEGTTTKATPADETIKRIKGNKGDQKKSERKNKNRRKKDRDSR
jgi:hypothetical protein